jgi:hypothetical protein
MDEICFVSTEKMERDRKTDFIENTLKLRKISFISDKLIVQADSLADCMGRLY